MNRLLTCILLLPFWLSSLQASSSVSDKAVVHAVLFYSPTCGHCHYVITEVLPTLYTQYGDQLSMIGVDVTQPGGQALFLAALQYFNLESGGVPMLVVGDHYLVGDIDIPEQFPGLIDQYLAQGGVDWPAIPGLAEALMAPQPTPVPSTYPLATQTSTRMVAGISTATPTSVAPTSTLTPGVLWSGSHTLSVKAAFASDPQGNSLAVVVLVGMILSFVAAILYFRHTPGAALARPWNWAIPIMCIIGLGIAGYLAYVETTQVEAICGPVGDCNTVQQSAYAQLFGILPIGIMGMVGYVIILLAWVVGRFAGKRQAAYTSLVLFGMSAFGVLFSIYLTFLEPFVIGATCAWCLTSAIIMTALLWLSIAPAKLAFTSLFYGEKHAFKRRSSSRTI
jgi:uncharacterized membrane protein